MECPRKGWLSGVAAALLLLPGVVSSQTPPTASKEPPKTEVDRLIFKGVKGSAYPVVTNLFGTQERIELAFGPKPEATVRELLAY